MISESQTYSVNSTGRVLIGSDSSMGVYGRVHLKNLGPNRVYLGARSVNDTSPVTDFSGYPLEVGESIVLVDHKYVDNSSSRNAVSAAHGTCKVASFIEKES